ncbi:MAG TPA: outer membrane protein transport protein [Aliidongia sp.]|nr:outer membrane protein transport protein [Aliidongia sp.]
MDYCRFGPAVALGALVSTLATHQARASAFALQEFSAISTGSADAGAASANEDLSTIFFNPAGMTAFDGLQNSAVATYVLPQARMHITSARENVGLPAGTAPTIQGGDGRDFPQDKVVPAGFVSYALADDFRVGLGLTVPFGLLTSYGADSQARYQALKSEVEAFDFNPSFAWKVNNWLSVGAGVSEQKVKAKLTNALDLGAIVPVQLNQLGLFNLVGPGAYAATVNQTAGRMANDGRVDLRGTSWGTGWNAGIQLRPFEGTTIGMSYRSGIEHQVQGRADFAVPTSAIANIVAAMPASLRAITLIGLAQNKAFQNTDFDADLSLPGQAWFGITQQVTPQLSVSFSYKWTNWSKFESLMVGFGNPAQPGLNQHEGYRDSSFAALGGSYRLSEKWTIRGGVAFDQTPVVDAYRDFRVPDADRYWLASGFSYRLSDKVELAGSYRHVSLASSRVNHVDPATGLNTVSGTPSGDMNLFALEALMKF